MTESYACIACGADISHQNEFMVLKDRRKGLPGSWGVRECKSCGSLSLVPTPTEADLNRYYASYTTSDTVEIKTSTGSRFPSLRRLYHWFSGDVDPRDFVHVPRGARVLDFGSGQATYLKDFNDRGIDIFGAELTDTLVDASRRQGLRVTKVHDFDSIPFADGEFDVVYLMQVFEHLRDPRRFMSELTRILKPGGSLYLALPNANSMWRGIFRANWVSGWFAPFHLSHFTSTALRELANSHGLQTVKTWSRTPESWFRLNLNAALHPEDCSLDMHSSWIDRAPARYIAMLALFIIELFSRNRDCLVMHFVRRR